MRCLTSMTARLDKAKGPAQAHAPGENRGGPPHFIAPTVPIAHDAPNWWETGALLKLTQRVPSVTVLKGVCLSFGSLQF